MPRLKAVAPLLQEVRPLVAGVPSDAAGVARQRKLDNPLRRLYSTKRWRDLRRAIFKRDGYTCAKTGVKLVGKHPAPNSPVLDHKVPHRGRIELFWDPDNLQTVSKAYHDGEKQKLERAGHV